jgi:molybdopterin-containing oxidoreductase family iron-sulfur binding subunit
MRGVMEKCTYCVQRIVRARVEAKAEGREMLRDGEALTACQQACPARAIVFGNQADPKSLVAAAKHDARNYTLLEEFNFRPRTSYLAKLRNPNPKLERSKG